LDSLSCLSGDRIKTGARVIDIGSGAGFPGVPLKIVRSDLAMTLLEAANRRVAFLEILLQELALKAMVLHGRAEVLGHSADHREVYDAVVSRATAPAPKLVELVLPFVMVGGVALLPKGAGAVHEMARAAELTEALGGRVEAIDEVQLPRFAGRRYLVVVRKVAPTPTGFPRRPTALGRRPSSRRSAAPESRAPGGRGG